mgnify:CR=1 FL=1
MKRRSFLPPALFLLCSLLVIAAAAAGGVAAARAAGCRIHGMPGLNVFNAAALESLRDFGVADAVLSVGLTLRQAAGIPEGVPGGGVIIYIKRKTNKTGTGLQAANAKVLAAEMVTAAEPEEPTDDTKPAKRCALPALESDGVRSSAAGRVSAAKGRKLLFG